ncbi:MAG: hypothetical protein BZ136_07455 [Methanosphaera sp. rholeuAM74]|nr:MAG: hypothetical protein BZ136_07455 [Methanosphaera sp. rholeuAM74]
MKHEGYEFLESEITIYNMLARRQREGDEILGLHNIQLICDDYKERDNLDVNNIYVVRGDTQWDKQPLTFSGEGYITKVYIVINVGAYDIVEASALLKSTVKSILQYLEFESLKQYTHVNKIQPRYTDPGILREYTIELDCIEIAELGLFSPLSRDLRVDLQVRARVQGEEEFKKIFPPATQEAEVYTWEEEDDNDGYDNDYMEFAGG